jgi:hypothetical protein
MLLQTVSGPLSPVPCSEYNEQEHSCWDGLRHPIYPANGPLRARAKPSCQALHLHSSRTHHMRQSQLQSHSLGCLVALSMLPP